MCLTGFDNYINDRNNKELPHVTNLGDNYQSQGDNCATSSADPSIDSCELNLHGKYFSFILCIHVALTTLHP